MGPAQGALWGPPDARAGRAGRLQQPRTLGFLWTSCRPLRTGPHRAWLPTPHPHPQEVGWVSSQRSPTRQSPVSGPTAQLHLLAQTRQAQVPLRGGLLGPRRALLRPPGRGELSVGFPRLPTPDTDTDTDTAAGRTASTSGPGGPKRTDTLLTVNINPKHLLDPEASRGLRVPLRVRGWRDRSRAGEGPWRQGLHGQPQPPKTPVLLPPRPLERRTALRDQTVGLEPFILFST